jgi:hypothetical protein
MDEYQEPLEQRAPLLPTGVPNGLDEAPRSTRSSRQTRQVSSEEATKTRHQCFPMASALRMRYSLKPNCPLLS